MRQGRGRWEEVCGGAGGRGRGEWRRRERRYGTYVGLSKCGVRYYDDVLCSSVGEANSYNAHFFSPFFFLIADSSFFLFAFFLGPYSERNFF